MQITLYSTHCPICNMIETKLKENGITYNEINDKDIMIQKGFRSVPILEVDNKIMNSSEALKYIEAHKKGLN